MLQLMHSSLHWALTSKHVTALSGILTGLIFYVHMCYSLLAFTACKSLCACTCVCMLACVCICASVFVHIRVRMYVYLSCTCVCKYKRTAFAYANARGLHVCKRVCVRERGVVSRTCGEMLHWVWNWLPSWQKNQCSKNLNKTSPKIKNKNTRIPNSIIIIIIIRV